ncbi:MAG TPA: sulfatase-like hydrolase/transferase, partial [Trueperaceae bacterium]|nr:sulfatase-like hydrolase/transferase [Trueperaceae bacterium]
TTATSATRTDDQVTNPPNVLVIMADQMKATASHLYGNEFCHTPGLERLAAAGTLFTTAITPQPLCVPARVAVWTSRWPHTTGARLNETPMPPGQDHAFRLWREAGFTTALIGKDHCFADPEDRALFDVRCPIGHDGLPRDDAPTGMAWVRPITAIDEAHSVRRSMPRQGPALSYAISDVDPAATSTGLVTDQTIAWLESLVRGDDARPFAAWVSYPDPHTPYEVPRAWADTVPPASVVLPPDQAEDDATLPERNRVLRRILDVSAESEDDLRQAVAVYHAQVRFVDDGVGRILDALERLGLREDTIVVFCSDHGDFAGEHCMTRKGGLFYDCLVRVPLIVAWPGHVPAGAVEASPVNLLDIVPTLLNLQGLEVPAAMMGQPLATVTDAARRVATFSEYGAGGQACTLADVNALPEPHGLAAAKATLSWREAEGRRKMVRTTDWKYVTDPLGDLDELYDLKADPFELTNLAAEPGHASRIAQLQRLLLDWALTTEDHRPPPLPPAAPRLGTTTGSSS